jgi:hypothetical protein
MSCFDDDASVLFVIERGDTPSSCACCVLVLMVVCVSSLLFKIINWCSFCHCSDQPYSLFIHFLNKAH